MFKKYPPLKIHSWGGLGSQLFALSLAVELKARFPSRDQVIVLHTGGVTKRNPELISLFPEFNYIEIDDFSLKIESSRSSKSFHIRLFSKVKRFLALLSKFLAEENDGKTRRVSSWTLSVRGHYLYRKVNINFLSILIDRMRNTEDIDEYLDSGEVVLHYRLGDLMNLTEKSPVEPTRIIKLLETLNKDKRINILSDSPEIATKLLSSNSKALKFRALELPTAKTLLAGTHAGIFIGTSSKISYWIVLLRLYLDNSSINYLPESDFSLINILAGESHDIRYF